MKHILFILALTILACHKEKDMDRNPNFTKTLTAKDYSKIDSYCDSINRIKNLQKLTKICGGVNLEYYFNNSDKILKIIEEPSGYRYITATNTYYFKNEVPVFVHADIEINPMDTDTLIYEFRKIYLQNDKIQKDLISEQEFNADSLYKDDTKIEIVSRQIRQNAKFIENKEKENLSKDFFEIIHKYQKAFRMKENNPFLEKLHSPFI